MIFNGVIAALVVFLFSSAAFSAEYPDPECTKSRSERTTALKDKNWNALESAAVKFIEACGKGYNEEDLAKANAELSLVLRMRNDPKNAAEFANRAIGYSKEPDFHIEKAIVFVQLHQLEEAGLELDVAELMAKLALKKNELRIITYVLKDPEYYAKQKKHYEAILKEVKATRKEYLSLKPPQKR